MAQLWGVYMMKQTPSKHEANVWSIGPTWSKCEANLEHTLCTARVYIQCICFMFALSCKYPISFWMSFDVAIELHISLSPMSLLRHLCS